MGRCGTTLSHCCWLGDEGECRFLRLSVTPGFIWECSLRVKYGSWDSAVESDEYKRHVAPHYTACGYHGMNCGDWPLSGQKCNDCGEEGDG